MDAAGRTRSPREASVPEPTTPTPDTAIAVRLLVVLALLSAIAPVATDLYLPAFPTMTTDLRASAAAVQLTLTAFLIGIAIGQLVFGPLSDRFGRFRPLLIGSALCVVASAAAALAPTVDALVAARFVQGLTGAAGMVIGRAIISDLAQGKAAARAFSLMMIVGGVAPVVAPLAGSVLVADLGWRGILWVVFGLTLVMLLAIVFFVRESHPARALRPGDGAVNAGSRAVSRAVGDPRAGAATHPEPARGSALRSLATRVYLGNTIAFAFGFSVMMAYISASPFVYQVMMGLSATEYGLLFGLNAVGLTVMSAVSAKLSARYSVRSLLVVGLTLVGLSTAAVLAITLAGVPAIWLAVPFFTAVTSLGLVLGNATALALAAVPKSAGLASAVLGAAQFVMAAVVSPLVGLGGESTAVPLAIVMIVAAVVALGGVAAARAPRAALSKTAA